jgi:predicted metal-dependent phosphotriesterase family hydrolase
MIQTVLGPIAPAELGVCLPHEHIWCDQRLAPRPELFDVTRSTGTYMRLDSYEHMVDELSAYGQAGGRAIVEVTCDGWGRDLDMLARLSEVTGVHIVATAGYYIEPCMPLFVAEWPLEKLADHMTREVEEGIGADHRKCGILKSAIHRARVEGLEEKVLRAVAIVQQRTGLAVTTHTTGSRRQEIPGGNATVEQLQILKVEGVSPTRVIAGHTDERPDIDVLAGLADEGCYVQFDVIGKEHWLLDATRAELVHALIVRGYADHLLLSHDRNRGYEMRYGGSSGYCHLFESFLPRLRRLGVTEDQIDAMLVRNPARALNRA